MSEGIRIVEIASNFRNDDHQMTISTGDDIWSLQAASLEQRINLERDGMFWGRGESKGAQVADEYGVLQKTLGACIG